MELEKVSDLLLELVRRERLKISDFEKNLSHPGTIGDMYEGLSKKIIDAAIFKGLGLRVVDGFVRGSDGKISRQIDCMLVAGSGEQVPNTSHFVYDFENVVAVLESKKNLFSGELASSYKNMLSVSDVFVPNEKTGVLYRDVMSAFEYFTASRIQFPLEKMDMKKQFYWHVLVIMFAMPLRVVMGYDGFSSERAFRESFVKYLDKNKKTFGFGPNSMPDLLICSNYSIVKCNFQPLKPWLMDDEKFPLFTTGTQNPLYYLLLMIWAKLQIRFNLPDSIWNFDPYSTEQLKSYLFAKLVVDGQENPVGWGYVYAPMSEQELSSPPEKKEWVPFEVSLEAFAVANMLCKIAPDPVDLLKTDLPKEKYESLKRELKETRLFSVEGDFIYLLAQNLLCCIWRGKYLIGENSDGDFSIWIKKIHKD